MTTRDEHLARNFCDPNPVLREEILAEESYSTKPIGIYVTESHLMFIDIGLIKIFAYGEAMSVTRIPSCVRRYWARKDILLPKVCFVTRNLPHVHG